MIFTFFAPQIGTRFALTAAHCLFDHDDIDDNDGNDRELLPASAFSVILGLHDRLRTDEPKRWINKRLNL